MQLWFGTDTVTVISQTQTGIDGTGAGILTTTSTAVPGCRHRPVITVSARGAGMARQQEGTQVGVSVGTEWWETTAPAAPAILAAKPSDQVQFNGVTYQIITGIKPIKDGMGNVIGARILSEAQDTGF